MISAYNAVVTNQSPLKMYKAEVLSITAANTAITLPANAMVMAIQIENLTANAVTGGIKIGTTAGGVDIVAAQAVGANAKVVVASADVLLKFFSSTLPQIIYADAVTSFNSAKLNLRVVYTLLA